MKSRFHFVITWLTACLVLCAGSQAAICELACGLGRNVPCHDSASPQATPNRAVMEGMAHMHCSGGMNHAEPHALNNLKVILDAQIGSPDRGRCGHSLPVAVVDPASSTDSFTQMHWVLIATVISRDETSFRRFGSSFEAPPLSSPVDPLFVTLRV